MGCNGCIRGWISIWLVVVGVLIVLEVVWLIVIYCSRWELMMSILLEWVIKSLSKGRIDHNS